MLMFLSLVSLVSITLVSSFSVQSFACHRCIISNDSNKRAPEILPCNERKKYGVLHLGRLGTGIDDSLSPPKEADGNISYLRSRFGLKDEWFTKNSRYSEVNNMDRAVMMERITWIKKRLKLNQAQLGKLIQRCPIILTLSPEMNLEPTIEFLQQELALNNTRLSTLIVRRPSILSLGINKNQTLQRNLDWIKNRLHLSDPKLLGKFVVAAPPTLTLDVENNLEPTLSSLQERLGLNETQVAKLCIKWPMVLTRSYSQSIAPKLDWLENTLHLCPKQVVTMIGRLPQLLTYSLDEGMKPKRRWLKDRLNLNDQEVGRLIQKAPSILGVTVDNLEAKLKWFQDNLFLETRTDLGQFLLKVPSILTLNVLSNLEPTFDFYRDHLGEVRGSQFVVGAPVVLALSLERRLKPRMEQVEEMGILMDSTCMRRVCMYTKPKWLSWLGKDFG